MAHYPIPLFDPFDLAQPSHFEHVSGFFAPIFGDAGTPASFSLSRTL